MVYGMFRFDNPEVFHLYFPWTKYNLLSNYHIQEQHGWSRRSFTWSRYALIHPKNKGDLYSLNGELNIFQVISLESPAHGTTCQQKPLIEPIFFSDLKLHTHALRRRFNSHKSGPYDGLTELGSCDCGQPFLKPNADSDKWRLEDVLPIKMRLLFQGLSLGFVGGGCSWVACPPVNQHILE